MICKLDARVFHLILLAPLHNALIAFFLAARLLRTERRGRAGERQQEEEKLRGYSRTVMDENRWRRRQQQQAGEKWGHDMFELQQEPAPPTDKRQSADTKTDTQATERASTRGRPATDLRNKLHTGSRKSRGEMYAELQMQQDREEQASKEREAREREQLEALLAR